MHNVELITYGCQSTSYTCRSSTRLHNRSRFDNVESWFPNFSCSIAKEEMEGKNSEFIFKSKSE